MLKICDDLVSGRVTREEILEQNTTEVDSTTDTEATSPVKKVKVTKTSAFKKSTKTNKCARIEAAKNRAKAIFANTASNSPEREKSSCDTASTAELQRQLALQRKEIETLQRQLQRTRT